jgi:hypothetical protein
MTAKAKAGASAPAEHRVQRRTPSHVRPRPPQVPHQLGVGAAGGFEGAG